MRALKAAIAGARAGLTATTAMSAPMAAAERLGLMGEQPPEKITDRAVDEAGIDAAPPTRRALSAASHLAFGAGAGALYAVVDDRVRLPGPPLLRGMAFGLGVWAASYRGWIPALGIIPKAEHDHPGRRWTMVAAHVVYGATLAQRLEQLRR